MNRYGTGTIYNMPTIEFQRLIDRENFHYMIYTIGWYKRKRAHSCVFHADIIDGKIWIQHDGTDVGFAAELEEMGVPKENIILAFHHPSKWEYTRFGTDAGYVDKIVNSEKSVVSSTGLN
ncbi:MAG: XisI protein [Leptospiraceae bacterium]|nr:XisI protein [Leptospiraceae bacterium]